MRQEKQVRVEFIQLKQTTSTERKEMLRLVVHRLMMMKRSSLRLVCGLVGKAAEVATVLHT